MVLALVQVTVVRLSFLLYCSTVYPVLDLVTQCFWCEFCRYFQLLSLLLKKVSSGDTDVLSLLISGCRHFDIKFTNFMLSVSPVVLYSFTACSSCIVSVSGCIMNVMFTVLVVFGVFLLLSAC